jgi:hypothetical protein
MQCEGEDSSNIAQFTFRGAYQRKSDSLFRPCYPLRVG